MIVLKATIIARTSDFGNFEAAAGAVNVLGPGSAAILAEQLLCMGNGDATDVVLNMVNERPLIVRDSIGEYFVSGL